MAGRYVKPSVGTRLFNLLPMLLARLGISVYGSCTLAVRGRKTGAWRTVPVNVLEHAGLRRKQLPDLTTRITSSTNSVK